MTTTPLTQSTTTDAPTASTACRCQTGHRGTIGWLRCRIGRRAHTVIGAGRFAVVSCAGRPLISLHADVDDALDTAAKLNRHRCGSKCRQRHDVLALPLGITMPCQLRRRPS